MNKNQIRKEIAALIDSIKEHSDNIGEKQHIPQLELELILLKIEKLYQKSIVYNYLNSVPPQDRVNDITPERELPKTEQKTVTAKKEEPKAEPVKPVNLFGESIKPAEEKQKAEKKVDRKEEKREERPAQNTIHILGITDIRSAIGINDKFQFANELFGGNMQEYEIAIQQLNTAETIDSALEYFMSIQQLYNWDNENATVKRLFDLVERRYR
jgi:hypothetical protein